MMPNKFGLKKKVDMVFMAQKGPKIATNKLTTYSALIPPS